VSAVKRKVSSESGLSLVELMVVLVIIGVVASLALFTPGNANNILKRQNGSRQLKEALERARFDSVKRRADGTAEFPYAKVEVRSDRFILTTFSIVPGAPGVAKTREVLLPSGVIINHYSSGTLPMTINFNRRGETSGGIPQFRVCNVSCSSPTDATSDILVVTPTGTVDLLSGSSSIPSFANPTLVGNPTAGESINNQVVVP
jgi:prepilin-type N-terminal cleavage/methylation domain-containing protein